MEEKEEGFFAIILIAGIILMAIPFLDEVGEATIDFNDDTPFIEEIDINGLEWTIFGVGVGVLIIAFFFRHARIGRLDY